MYQITKLLNTNVSFKQSVICFKKNAEHLPSVWTSNVHLLDNVIRFAPTAVYRTMITFTSFYACTKGMHGLAMFPNDKNIASECLFLFICGSFSNSHWRCTHCNAYFFIILRCTPTVWLNCLSSFKMYVLSFVKVPRPDQALLAFSYGVCKNKEEK